MSDGPYRTLNLRPQWKQLLKRAYERAFNTQDIIDAICPALERDCAWELPKEFVPMLRAFCTRGEPSLFGDSELDRLKRLCAGRGTLGIIMAECAAQALADGMSGETALQHALEQGLADRLVRNARQMEEHILRESGDRKAAEVRNRLSLAIASAPVSALATKLIKDAASLRAAPPKHSGLDDGVELR
jgi:hypothetical protein